MNSHFIKLPILFLIINFSCSTADNQNCNRENLLKFASQGAQGKIDACYKSGAQILISSTGQSIRQIALNNNHTELAAYFIRVQNKEYNKHNSPLDTTTLWQAIEYDNVEIITHYLAKGFDLRPKYRDGLSPIVYAIFNESIGIITLLLKEGVDVGYEFDSRPLICMAAMFSQIETVKVMLSYGANVNDLDGSGVTPLMFAAREENIEMVKLLLVNGADKSLREISNKTAADMVVNNEELKKILAL